jgi:hypothetical protein
MRLLFLKLNFCVCFFAGTRDKGGTGDFHGGPPPHHFNWNGETTSPEPASKNSNFYDGYLKTGTVI